MRCWILTLAACSLSFAVFAHDDAELYTFQSFEVTIDREG
jgi:hypothetical protein